LKKDQVILNVVPKNETAKVENKIVQKIEKKLETAIKRGEQRGERKENRRNNKKGDRPNTMMMQAKPRQNNNPSNGGNNH